MRDPDAFDAFYRESRTRLLAQTVAVSGEMRSARTAVRDAFAVAWHRWERVATASDPESWVRRVAWRRVARWRPRHRLTRGRASDPAQETGDDEVSPRVAEFLAALQQLSPPQRRIVVLSHTTALAPAEVAREVGLPTDEAAGELDRGCAALVDAVPPRGPHRDHDPPADPGAWVPDVVAAVAEEHWPRGSILRRAGSVRRRTHTVLGILTTVLLLLASGVAVAEPRVAEPGLAGDDPAAESEAVRIREPAPPPAQLHPRDLLTAGQTVRLARSAAWAAPRTTDNLEGDGLALPCQRDRFADMSGVGALLRTFPSVPRRGGPTTSATQLTELSQTRRAARGAYRRTQQWYAGCVEPRVQLLSTHRVDRVGQDATLFVLRSWATPVTTTTVGVARTGRVTTTVVEQVTEPGGGPPPSGAGAASGSGGSATAEPGAPDTGPLTSLVGAAVNGLCGSPGATSCAGPPQPVPEPPLPVGPVPGMLVEVDLPPVPGVDAPWVGTRPEPAVLNLAATRCDETAFDEPPVTTGRTRSFLITGADLPDQFGLTQTVGVLPGPAQAEQFVAEIQALMDGCEEVDLGTQVDQLFGDADADGAAQEGAAAEAGAVDRLAWRVTSEISEEQSVEFWMAVVRAGPVVSQIGFVPTAGATLGSQSFEDLVDRALARLPDYPRR